ncbi:MAG: hypothetical protein ACJASJ_001192, partial [Candidatus Azotimanducaceae bacterium]
HQQPERVFLVNGRERIEFSFAGSESEFPNLWLAALASAASTGCA